MIGVSGSGRVRSDNQPTRAATSGGKSGSGERSWCRGSKQQGSHVEDSDDDDDEVPLSVILERKQRGREMANTTEEEMMPRPSEESAVTEKVNEDHEIRELNSEPEPEQDPKPEQETCPDSEFHDFEKDRSEKCLDVDQIWAMYDDLDAMPRWYGRVRKVLSVGSKVLITWLEACPDSKDEQDWREEELPFSCGAFKKGEVQVVERVSLSHRMDYSRGKRKDSYMIFPKKGETWALFKDWDIKRGCRPVKHGPPFSYDLVEVLSDFREEVGVEVCYLRKVEGFVSVFEKASCEKFVSFFILPNEVMFSFSHRIPSYRMTGREREGVPAGSFELDTAALPNSVCNVEQVACIQPQGESASFMAKENISSPRKCERTELDASKSVDLESSDILMATDTSENRAHTSEVLLHARVGSSTSHRGARISLKRKVIHEDRLDSKKLISEDEVHMSQSCMMNGDEDQVTVDYGHVSKQQLDLKQTELATLEARVKACKMELERTEASLKERQGELLAKESCLHSVEESIKKTNLKLEEREDQFKAIRRSVDQSSVELRSKESQLESLERSIKESKEKEKALHYVKDELRECCQVFELKEKELNELKKSIEATNGVLDVKMELLKEIKAKLKLKTGKLKSMEEHRDHLKKTIMYLKQQRDHYHSIPNPSQGHSAVESRMHQPLLAGYATKLQLFLDKHWRKHDAFQAEVSTALQKSPDAAKLVLEVMREFYPPRSENWDMGYGLSVTRRSCINLLEHLLNIRPDITSDVREQAVKLAQDWKARIMMMKPAANSLEVLGFLQLVSAFRLASYFSADEVRRLIISGIPKQGNGAEIWRSLGVMDDLAGL